MAFDGSGITWSYPEGIPVGDADNDGVYPGDESDDCLLSPPHSSASRWASLETAIQQFLTTLNNSVRPPKVGVVTWASFLDESTYEYSLTGETVPAVVRDVPIGRNYDLIYSSISNRGNSRMLGGTNIAAGIDEAVFMLTGLNTPSKKTIILMTDGLQTEGRPAIDAANDANAAGVVVHVVTFLGGDQSAMAEVARVTGGRHIHAASNAELTAAFDELARLLPVALVD